MESTFTSYTASSSSARITVVPELGAKIVSLQNLKTGHEWMWRRPEATLFRNALVDRFEESPLIGADECVPTVDPCSWRGRSLPDHGELWASAWSVDEDLLSRNVIRTAVRFPVSPFSLERQISVGEQEIGFKYELKNHSNERQKFLWAFHPLLPLAGDTEIELPPWIEQVRPTSVSGIAGLTAEPAWEWPQPGPGIHLNRGDLGPTPACAKMFADFSGRPEGFARLRQGSERLIFEFSSADVPFLGIWLTRGGWNGYTHLAIEPTNANCDSLAGVAETDRTVIPALAISEWRFRVRFGSGSLFRYDTAEDR